MKQTIGLFGAVLAMGLGFAEMEPATPESQGVDSGAILNFIDAAERTFDGSRAGHLHGFVIVRHGKVIAEGSWKPFDTLNEPHMLYSHSKSFTSTAVGLVAEEGKLDLDERVVDIFPGDVPESVSPNLAQLRVRDLLTMNVGAEKDHSVGRNPKDWVKWFLRKDLQRRPGTGFKYDSDATYVLAAIVEQKTGEKMMNYLKRKLFDKIGITQAWTTYSPEGIPCGGWGMNMTTRELARFGQLYLQNGRWGKEQVFSPCWAQLATTRHTWSRPGNVGIQALGEDSDWTQGYGFQFWRCRHGAFRADGAYGQYTIVMPQEDMVVSIHAGVGNMQKEINLVWEHLLCACKEWILPENAELQKKLSDRLAKLEIKPLARGDGKSARCGKFMLKANHRGFKSLEILPVSEGGYVCKLMTRVGEQTFKVGENRWQQGTIRIDPEPYEALGGYVGEHEIAASGGVDTAGTLRIKAYLTGDTGHFDFAIDQKGKLTGEFWAMNGCKLESK